MRQEFLNAVPVKFRITTRKQINATPIDPITVAKPIRTSRRKATHTPIGATTNTTSSLTNNANRTAPTYQRHLRLKAAHSASAMSTPKNESGWKFSTFVQLTVGYSKYVQAKTQPSTSLSNCFRAKTYTGMAPLAMTTV